MMHARIDRRSFLQGGGALAAAMTAAARARSSAAGRGRAAADPDPAADRARAERLQRLAKARALMQQHGIGAIIVEPGRASTISPASNGGASSG